MQRVFVDANVIFSAAYNPKRRVSVIWALPQTQIVTSPYAAAEALRNLRRKYPLRVEEYRRLLARTGLVRASTSLPPSIAADLSPKDHPILSAAIACRADYLLTGDTDFDRLFGRVIEGTLILRPGDYLRLRGH